MRSPVPIVRFVNTGAPIFVVDWAKEVARRSRGYKFDEYYGTKPGRRRMRVTAAEVKRWREQEDWSDADIWRHHLVTSEDTGGLTYDFNMGERGFRKSGCCTPVVFEGRTVGVAEILVAGEDLFEEELQKVQAAVAGHADAARLRALLAKGRELVAVYPKGKSSATWLEDHTALWASLASLRSGVVLVPGHAPRAVRPRLAPKKKGTTRKGKRKRSGKTARSR